MTEKDNRERQESRDMLKELHLVVIGDESKGIEGIIHRQKQTLERISRIETRLENDNKLLWWNRTANGIFDNIKKSALYLITFAIIAAIVSGNGISGAFDYISKKLGIK